MLAAGALLVGMTGCGDDGGGSSGTIIRGTIDQPSPSILPAHTTCRLTTCWSTSTRTCYQIPPGGSEPEPEAAESCDFTDQENTTFECTLKDGLEFSDGSPLTAEDVKFSFDRNIEIADPNGASSLLTNLKSTRLPTTRRWSSNSRSPT